MGLHKLTPLILCLFFIGCITLRQPTYSDLQAQDHMHKAHELEVSKKYQKAINEYVTVAERYPNTECYQAAVRKVALLNLNPDNPEADSKTALHWLQVYLTLPITPEERESEQLRISMLEQIDRLKTEISRQVVEKNTLKTVKHKQSNKLAHAKKRVKDLEEELVNARVQLEEMKEVDLRMHTRRVNGGNGELLDSARNTIEPFPEGYSVGKESGKLSTQEKLEVSPPDQEKPIPNGMSGLHPGKNNTPQSPKSNSAHVEIPEKSAKAGSDSTSRGAYPFTVQVGSFPDRETSISEAIRSKEYGEMGFTSLIHIPGKGTYYRIFIGAYPTLDAAKKYARELRKRDYPEAFAVKLPYAVQINIPSSCKDKKQIECQLQSAGFLPYSIPGGIPGSDAILLGAFKTFEESEKASDSLKKDGLNPSVVLR